MRSAWGPRTRWCHAAPPQCCPLAVLCRDLARAARASREFASYVREQRRKLRMVVVPEGVSYTAVRWGLCSACAARQKQRHREKRWSGWQSDWA